MYNNINISILKKDILIERSIRNQHTATTMLTKDLNFRSTFVP